MISRSDQVIETHQENATKEEGQGDLQTEGEGLPFR
jgi:hypothetical protein